MLGGGGVMLVGATLQAASSNMGQLIAGRIVTGLVSGTTLDPMVVVGVHNRLFCVQGNGANFSTIPVWASEISGFEERGKVAAFNGWLVV